MNFKQHMVLVVGGAISLLLMVAALFFLFKFQARYGQVKQDLESSLRQLDQLQKRDPYPSKENVTLITESADERQGFFDTLLESLRGGQVEGQVMEAARFGTVLETTTRKLRGISREAGVTLPEQFAFGFDRFEKGALAKSEDIPRLYRQLKTSEKLIIRLLESGIKEIVSLERERFDEKTEEVEEKVEQQRSGRRSRSDPAAGRRSRGGRAQPTRPAPPPVKDEASDLYSKESLTVKILTREEGLWNMLDILATSDLFTMVTSVELQTEASEGNPLASQQLQAKRLAEGSPSLPHDMGSGEEGEAIEETPPTRDERVVAGRERILVTMGVDVIRFPESKGEDEVEDER